MDLDTEDLERGAPAPLSGITDLQGGADGDYVVYKEVLRTPAHGHTDTGWGTGLRRDTASSDLINPAFRKNQRKRRQDEHIGPPAPVAGSDLYVFRPVAYGGFSYP